MKKLLQSVAIMATSFTSFAQVGIGTSTPNASAALEIKSTNQGLLPPRLSVDEVLAIDTPSEGLLLYCTDCDVKGIFVFNGIYFIGLIDGLGLNAARTAIITSNAVLAQIGSEADASTSAVTAAQLHTILPALTNVTNGNEAAYRSYNNNNAVLFSNPATQAEVQAAIAIVNSNAVLEKIATQQTVTLQELQLLTTTGRIDAKLDSYNNYIVHFDPAFTDAKATLAEVNAMYTLLTTNVVTNIGRIWMDRNLGAANVAAASNDASAYGDLYQWGRTTDGHQMITSVIASGPIDSGKEGSDFITVEAGPPPVGGGDWLSEHANRRWDDNTKGAQDPCPSGFRVPSITEWKNEVSISSISGAFLSPLKLTTPGLRSFKKGDFALKNVNGFYWSSSVSSSNGNLSQFLKTEREDVITTKSFPKAFGFSIRCIKE